MELQESENYMNLDGFVRVLCDNIMCGYFSTANIPDVFPRIKTLYEVNILCLSGVEILFESQEDYDENMPNGEVAFEMYDDEITVNLEDFKESFGFEELEKLLDKLFPEK